MDLPALPALQALEAVFRHGSVTRAARELHVSQSAVSHRLHALEQELGVSLIARQGRGVRLTASGARLAHASREAIATLESALQALRPKRADGRQALSISCSPSFAIRFLVPRLSTFRAAQPELDLRVASDDRASDLATAGVDASVRLAAGPVPELRCERLIDEVVFPVLSPRLLERGPPLRSPADLARHTLLHDEALAEDPRRVGWTAWLRAARVSQVNAQRGVRFSHAYLALEAASAGDGVALARRSLVARELAEGRLIAPLALGLPSGLSYWFITAAAPTAAIAALRSFLRRALRQAQREADQARARAARAGRPRDPARARTLHPNARQLAGARARGPRTGAC